MQLALKVTPKLRRRERLPLKLLRFNAQLVNFVQSQTAVQSYVTMSCGVVCHVAQSLAVLTALLTSNHVDQKFARLTSTLPC